MNCHLQQRGAALSFGDLPSILSPSEVGTLFRSVGLPCDAVTVKYLRLKPGQSALAGFVARGTDERGLAGEIRGYVRTFADEATAPGLMAAMAPALATEFGPGVRLLPSGRSILVLFPNDGRLKSLPQVTDREALDRGLTSLAGPWATAEIVPFSYEPERRFSARIVAAAPGGSSLVARVFPDGRATRIHRWLRDLHGRHHAPAIAEPIGTLFGGTVSIERQVDGATAQDAMRVGAGVPEGVAREVWRLHASEKGPRNARTPADLVRAATAAVDILGAAAPSMARLIHDALPIVVDRPPADSRRSPIHGDLRPSNVILTADGPVLVDLARATVGDPLEDVGNLVAHLLVDEARESDPTVRAAISDFRHRFLAAYRRSSDPRLESDLRFYVAIGLFERALVPLRTVDPCWVASSTAILELALRVDTLLD